MVQVRPDVMPEQVRSGLPLQGVLEEVDCTAIQILVLLDHREHIATGQHRRVSPTRFRLGDISEIVQVVLNWINHCSDFSLSSEIKPRLTSSS